METGRGKGRTDTAALSEHGILSEKQMTEDFMEQINSTILQYRSEKRAASRSTVPRELILRITKQYVDKITSKSADKSSLKDDIAAYSPKGRVQRKASERPRPDLPADAPANRAKKQIAVYLEPDFIDALNNAAKEKGVDRNTLIKHALTVFLSPK